MKSDVDGLVRHLLSLANDRRRVVAGPPGAGKSTFAEMLKARLDAGRVAGAAAVLRMDGYHFDGTLLDVRGHRSRKGTPHTFDVDGLAVVLNRLRAGDGRPVVVPVFDRTIEIARAGARAIEASARFVLSDEGRGSFKSV